MTIKPGTRCECRDTKCPTKVFPPWADGKDTHGDRILGGGCIADAVRLVTVPCILHDVDEYGDDLGAEQVPMCSLCAAWHEKAVRS